MTDLGKLVKPLVWHKSRGAHIMDGESHTVPTGYTVRYADENGWKWSTPLGAYGWECSPSLAQAAAQDDYTARIFAALDPEVLAKIRTDALREAAELVDDFRRAPATAGLGCDPMIEAILALIDKEDQA